MNEYRTIRLYGQLGSQYGRVHKLVVATASEAIRALSVIIPGFERFLIESERRGITFAVFNGKNNIGTDELELPATEIRIVPVIIGSKRGSLFQTILGVALVAVATFATWGTAGAGLTSAFAAGGFWGGVAMMGAAMTLGGIMQMLSPQPAGMSLRQDSENKPSYAFGGAVNTTAQGNPIPVLYGRHRIGGAVISAGVHAE